MREYAKISAMEKTSHNWLLCLISNKCALDTLLLHIDNVVIN